MDWGHSHQCLKYYEVIESSNIYGNFLFSTNVKKTFQHLYAREEEINVLITITKISLNFCIIIISTSDLKGFIVTIIVNYVWNVTITL